MPRQADLSDGKQVPDNNRIPMFREYTPMPEYKVLSPHPYLAREWRNSEVAGEQECFRDRSQAPYEAQERIPCPSSWSADIELPT